jgi:hypothetical protein
VVATEAVAREVARAVAEMAVAVREAAAMEAATAGVARAAARVEEVRAAAEMAAAGSYIHTADSACSRGSRTSRRRIALQSSCTCWEEGRTTRSIVVTEEVLVALVGPTATAATGRRPI